MKFIAHVLCLFVLLCQAQGDAREETLYVKTGTDLLLDVGKPAALKENDEMFWKFNSKVNIVKLTHTNEPIPLGNYTRRAELFPLNKTLLLKNVQKTDSGEYKAVVSGNKDQVLAQYQVTVLDPVSDVKLELKQCSSKWPDLVVTCRTLDGRLSSTFICEDRTCSHDGGEPVLKVYQTNDIVACNHSNQVSSTKDTKRIEDLCKQDPVNVALVATVVVLSLLVVCVAAAVVYCCCRRIQHSFDEIPVSPALPNEDKIDGGEDAAYEEAEDSEREPLKGPGPINDVQVEPPNTNSSMTGTHTAAPSGPPGVTEEVDGPAYEKPKASQGDVHLELKTINGVQGEPPNTNSSMTGTYTAAPSGPPGVTEEVDGPAYEKPKPLHENETLESGQSSGAQGEPPHITFSLTDTPAGTPTESPDTPMSILIEMNEGPHKSLQPGPSNGAKGEPPNITYSMTKTYTAAANKPPGKTERTLKKMNKDLNKLLQSMHENEPQEPGPTNAAQVLVPGDNGPESWHFWTGEDVVVYFVKPVALKKDDVKLKVKLHRTASQFSLPRLPRGQRVHSKSPS